MLRSLRPLFLVFGLALALAAGDARAETPTPTRKGDPVVWQEEWPRFRPAEMAFTGGMALNVAMALFLYPAPKSNWDGPILFDKPVRSLPELELPQRTRRALGRGHEADVAAPELLDPEGRRLCCDGADVRAERRWRLADGRVLIHPGAGFAA